MRNQRGMTLIELMIALVVFSLVMASALSLLSKQSKGFDRSSSDMGLLQNLRFAGDLLRQELRMAGANVPYKEPPIVYAGTASFAFNADYASNTDSLFAVYYDPGLLTGQTDALTLARRMTISGSSPAVQYPDSNYYSPSATNSPAETITWFFSLDSSTTVSNDYTILRQVNDGPPETVIRNVTQTGSLNFFKYYYKRVPASGLTASSLDSVPTAWIPLRHVQAIHGSVPDTSTDARIDSLAEVEVRFTVTNGLTGTDLRSRAISFTIPMPNIGTKKVTTCGDAPILGNTPVAVWAIDSTVSPYDTTMVLTWNQAIDETTGEQDVVAYVIWRRAVGATVWGEPIGSVPAGTVTPSFTDESAVVNVPGYQYALAAQDCTPTLSAQSAVNAPLIP